MLTRKISKNITLFVFLYILAGYNALAEVSVKKKVEIESSFFNPFLSLRFNDLVNIVIDEKYKDGSSVERWVAFDCKARTGKALYWDLLDKKGSLTYRFYGDNLSRYAPPHPIPKSKGSNDLADAVCGSILNATEWIYLEKINKYNNATLIDINNTVKTGNKLITRIGYAYDDIDYDPPYDAPFNLKVEFHAYDCLSKQDKVYGAVDVDDNYYITDSLTGKAIEKRASSFESHPPIDKALETLCVIADFKKFKGEGKYKRIESKEPTKKIEGMLPDFNDNNSAWLNKHTINNKVYNQAKIVTNLALPKFKRISWIENRTNEKESVPVIINSLPDGMTVRLDKYGIFDSQSIMVANSIQLKSALSISHRVAITTMLDSTLQFPLFSGQKYKTTVKVNTKTTDDKESIIVESCKVQNKYNVTEINDKFKGEYWLVNCDESNNEGKTTNIYAFLTDLNIFILIKRISNGVESIYKISDVNIIR